MGRSVVNEVKQNSVKYIEISSDHQGRRLDNYLFSVLKKIPKTRVYKMIRKGEVRIDGRRVKQDYRLQAGENLRVPPVYTYQSEMNIEPDSKVVEMIKNNILYKDRNLVILNKPSGMVVHGGTRQSYGVIEAVRKIFKDEASSIQLVHRLDKETSGVLMLARNMQYLTFLHDQFKAKSIRKVYKALLCGHLEKDWIKVDLPLLKNSLKSGERLVKVSDDGKDAETIFKLERHVGEMSFVEIELTTGRTHQIRVHANALGFPVAGDQKYGDKDQNKKMSKTGLNRLFLHAYEISVPGSEEYEPVSVSAPLPDDLSEYLNSIVTVPK